jgi:hypothetical protein
VDDRDFFEVRYFRRGPLILGNFALGVVIGISAWRFDGLPPTVSVGMAATALLLMLPILFKVETRVIREEVTISLPPFRLRQFSTGEIVSAEIVVVDHLVPVFGGWNARNSIASAYMTELEGDRSLGNRAVRMTLQSGRIVQVGSWRPRTLLNLVSPH